MKDEVGAMKDEAGKQGRRRVGLRDRLLMSQLVVLAVAIASLAMVSRLYTPRYFVVTLERMELRGVRIQQQVKGQILQGFEEAWLQGLFWSVVLGGGTAGGVSWWLSRRITRPLLRMEKITQQFAAGEFSSRVPPLEIPEFDRLGHSFNRMANDLEGVEQRRRELVGDLTHELRTPLTIVKGYLEGLADGAIAPTPATYQRLANETERLQRLVNDLQELSKLESGYLPIEARTLEIGPLVRQVCDRFANQIINSERLKLTTDLPNNLPAVWGDPARIEQILVNLLSNAFRHTDAGIISVRIYTQSVNGSQRVWIAVADTGEGIAEADLPHVFERFWRADRSRDRTSGGSGVGLAICRRLVELQGGTITAISQLGEGSTFSFSLPTAAAV
ncbi:MAG: HAMP domain-containing sensor histidine kinase [Cyanobacteria bacterium P01_D01_bin.1]